MAYMPEGWRPFPQGSGHVDTRRISQRIRDYSTPGAYTYRSPYTHANGDAHKHARMIDDALLRLLHVVSSKRSRFIYPG